MTETVTQILIHSGAEPIMELAFDLPRWPAFLPHYRWVKILATDGDRQTVEMACWRTGIPLRWRSYLWVLPHERRMRFEHIAGPARGMAVEWSLSPEGDFTRVAIRHEMSLKVPIVRTALGRWIVGEFFVGAVAGRTLAALKRAVEKD